MKTGVSGSGAIAAILLLTAFPAGAGSGPPAPGKPSELVHVFAGADNCPCHDGWSALISITGIDGTTVPFAIREKEAIVLTGGTISVFSAPPGEELLVSVVLYASGCGGGLSVEQRVAVAGANGVSVTDFDFDFGLAINADAILCVAASIGPTPLDSQGRFRGFRTKNK
jgi:hypothetical protein